MLLEASIVTRFSGFNLKSLILLFFTSILLSKLLLDKFKEAIRDLLRYLTGATYTDEFKDVNLLLVKFRDSNFVLFHRLRLVKL